MLDHPSNLALERENDHGDHAFRRVEQAEWALSVLAVTLECAGAAAAADAGGKDACLGLSASGGETFSIQSACARSNQFSMALRRMAH